MIYHTGIYQWAFLDCSRCYPSPFTECFTVFVAILYCSDSQVLSENPKRHGKKWVRIWKHLSALVLDLNARGVVKLLHLRWQYPGFRISFALNCPSYPSSPKICQDAGKVLHCVFKRRGHLQVCLNVVVTVHTLRTRCEQVGHWTMIR